MWYLSTFSFSFTKQKPLINGHGKIRPLLFPSQFIEFAIASIKRFFRSTFSKASISEIVQVCNKIKRQKWKQELFVIMPPFHDRERVTNFWNNSRKISNLKKKREIFQLKKGKFRNDRTRRQKQTYETARARSRSKNMNQIPRNESSHSINSSLIWCNMPKCYQEWGRAWAILQIDEVIW